MRRSQAAIEAPSATSTVRAEITVPHKGNGKLDPNDVFGLDDRLVEDGYWATIDGYKFKVARANNPDHESYLARMGEAKLRAYQNGELTAEENRRINGDLVGRSLLRDWDERFVGYTVEAGVAFCIRNPHITSQLITIAADYHNYLMSQRDEDSKN